MQSAPWVRPAEKKVSALLSALVKRFVVSRVKDFFSNLSNVQMYTHDILILKCTYQKEKIYLLHNINPIEENWLILEFPRKSQEFLK